MLSHTFLSGQFDEADVIQLPDHRFVAHCFERYGLNRGIYNTIDEWLYRFGVRDIVQRRQAVLAFLASLQPPDRTKGTYLKFGKGGLTKQLFDFMTKPKLAL